MSLRVEMLREKADFTSMSLYAVVKAKDKNDRAWKAAADVISVSAIGSSFNLPRHCEVGTLLSLMIPMPAHLRCYDYEKEFYHVWGLVQHCESVTAGDPPTYHVGVAFIGKNAPKGHHRNSQQHYRISGVDEVGMWTVGGARTPFKKRAETRFWKPVELYLALIEPTKGSPGGERSTAENVSRSGAAVFTTLEVGVGDRVKFISAELDFSGLAVVCHRQFGEDERTRLHLKFVDTTFPVEKLMNEDVAVERV